MELELKYIHSLEKTRAKKISILKAIYKQDWSICHHFFNRSSTLDEPFIINDSNSNVNSIAK